MHRPRPRLHLLLSVACIPLLQPQVAAQSPTSADERLRAVYNAEWSWRQKEMSDDSGYFPRVDAATQQAHLAYWTRALAEVDAIPFAELSAEEKINAQVFRTSIKAMVDDVRFKTYEAPFNSDTFFWTEFTPRQGFQKSDEYQRYLSRLRDVPRYFDEQMVNMRAGLARGFTIPRVSVVGRDKTIEPYVKGDSTNPLFLPFTQMPSSIPAEQQAAFRREAAIVVRDIVAPAYARLLTMMRDEYLPKARATLAATAMPDGAAYYQAMIEKYTTLTLTPQQIHEMGWPRWRASAAR